LNPISLSMAAVLEGSRWYSRMVLQWQREHGRGFNTQEGRW
jgi:hypothetical protein